MTNRIASARRVSILVATLIGFSLTGGCTGEILLRLVPKYGPVRVAGATGGSATVVPRFSEELQAPLYMGPNPAARQIGALDLATSAVSPVADVEGAWAADVVSSANWVAWLDRIGGSLQVLDRVANTGATHENGIDAKDPTTVLRAINGDRLLIHRPVAGTFDSINPQFELIVINLRTKERVTVADSWANGAAALDGDWLALMNDKGVQVQLIGLEYAANIDLVNLATNDRRRIASDLRTNGWELPLFIADGQVIWQEFKPGGFAARLQIYDIASAKASTLIEDFAAADEDKLLSDARGGRLLITRTRGNSLTPSAIAILAQPIGGSDVNLIAQYDTLPAGWYFPEARLTDGYATWTDPATGRLNAYDFTSGKSRSFVLP